MKSEIIFKNSHYTACAMRDGSLIVTHNRKKGGKRLIGDQAVTWINAIKTADDNTEINTICRVILN